MFVFVFNSAVKHFGHLCAVVKGFINKAHCITTHTVAYKLIYRYIDTHRELTKGRRGSSAHQNLESVSNSQKSFVSPNGYFFSFSVEN